MDEEEIVKLVKERVAGRSVGRGWRETNEGEVKKKKKISSAIYQRRFLGCWLCTNFHRISHTFERKMPDPSIHSQSFPIIIKITKIIPSNCTNNALILTYVEHEYFSKIYNFEYNKQCVFWEYSSFSKIFFLFSIVLKVSKGWIVLNFLDFQKLLLLL